MVKVRFLKAEVFISHKMYENSYAAMHILRILGIFPLEVKRKALGLFLKFNPLYAFYSCILGVATLSGLYYRVYQELISDTKSSQNVRTVDKFVRFTTINAFCLIVFYDAFIMPTNLFVFFKYIKYIGQVDTIIDMTFSKMNKYCSLLMLTMPLITNVIASTLDFYMHVRLFKVPLLATLKLNIFYYTTFIMAFIIICINRYMANCLKIRVNQMNKILNEEYMNIKMVEENEETETEDKGISAVSITSITHVSDTIIKVTQAYLKWTKAAAMVRDIFGIVLTVALVAILCQMVSSKYFIIMALEGRSRDVTELIDWSVIFSIQIMKLLLIIEPWHSCMTELDTLRSRVCNFLVLKLDKSCKAKVISFVKVMGLCPFTFTACGLFIINRLLYTTLIDVVITFLVISLQAEQEDSS